MYLFNEKFYIVRITTIGSEFFNKDMSPMFEIHALNSKTETTHFVSFLACLCSAQYQENKPAAQAAGADPSQ